VRRATSAALAVATIVGAAACGSTRTPATLPLPAPKTPIFAAADVAPLGVVHPEDLPAGWHEIDDFRDLGALPLAKELCGTDPKLGAVAHLYERDYGLAVASHRGDDARIRSSAAVTADSATAAREYAGVNQHTYTPCSLVSVGEDVRRTFLSNAKITVSVGARGQIDLGVPTTFEKYVTAGIVPGCGCERVFTTLVRARVGRVLIRIAVISPDEPINDGTVDAIAGAVVTRLQQAGD
jgi:hypothetical protein